MSVKCEGWSRSKPTAASRRDGSRVVAALRRGQQRQALTSRYSGRVSLSLSPLTLSVLPHSPQVFFSFFLLFFRLETGVFGAGAGAGFTFLNLPSFFLFLYLFFFFFFFCCCCLHVGWPAEFWTAEFTCELAGLVKINANGLQIWRAKLKVRGPSLFFFFKKN